MNLEIDHLLQIVESEEEAVKMATSTGLNIFSKTNHTGQGTSGIFLLFNECYYEFIWLRDEEEAKNNPLRFDLIFKAIRDGGSPFGVSMRGYMSDEELKDFTLYKPAYGNYSIYFTNESLNDPKLPLLFFHTHPERPNASDWHPINRKTADDTNTCNFDSVIRRFNSVEIHSPYVNTHLLPNVQVVKDSRHQMIINSGAVFKFSDKVELL